MIAFLRLVPVAALAAASALPATAPRGAPAVQAAPAAVPVDSAARAAVGFPRPARGMSPAAGVPPYWRTRAERTGYRFTADYEETMRYLRQLQAASNWVQVQTYGRTGQGRDLPLLVVSRDRAFTPEAARASGKPVVLVQCGIHSGEIEGKDAALALVRDAAVLRRQEELLEGVTLLVLPMLSPDSHERSGPRNRINQNGPESMGWRSTPVGLNLNRDYLKAETPEMRALLSQVFTRWWPHLLVDTHTTDGADYRYDLTCSATRGLVPPAPVSRWSREAFEDRVLPRFESMGHLSAPYLEFRAWSDPRTGFKLGDARPRYSNGYPPLHGRPAILVETHMLKPYEVRVRATYDLLVALLEEINARPAALTGAVAEAESQAVARGRAGDPARRELVLTSRAVPSDSVAFPYKGVRMRWERSDISGSAIPRFGTAPWDTVIPMFAKLEPVLVVRQPAGYLVPQEWTVCRDRLDVHGVRYRRFARDWSDTVEVQHVLEWSAAKESFEGHHLLTVSRVALERRARSYRAGDLWVPLDQRSAPVAVHLFEAQAPDGLMAWNYFDTVFEKKEYAEGYVIEPVARRMLERDPALAREFRARLASDSAFAASPFERLDFFYRRSPWADPLQDLHPVARALRPPPESVLAPEGR